jgi:large-conductance mechanosensitive channel
MLKNFSLIAIMLFAMVSSAAYCEETSDNQTDESDAQELKTNPCTYPHQCQ